MKGLVAAALAAWMVPQQGAPTPPRPREAAAPQALPPMAPNPFQPAPGDALRDARETHLRGLRRLTRTGSDQRLVSTGKGLLLASAHGDRPGCPPAPRHFNLFTADWIP